MNTFLDQAYELLEDFPLVMGRSFQRSIEELSINLVLYIWMDEEFGGRICWTSYLLHVLTIELHEERIHSW